MAQRRDDKLLGRVAVRLREIRKARGLTQAAVYEDTNVNVGNVESYNNNLTLTTLAILCDYYEMPLDEFFRGMNTE